MFGWPSSNRDPTASARVRARSRCVQVFPNQMFSAQRKPAQADYLRRSEGCARVRRLPPVPALVYDSGCPFSGSPPPKFNAQLFSVGRFHLYFPHATRGSRTFCVCDRGPVVWQGHPQLPSVPPSLLSKSALTSSPWHTHMAFCNHDLCACHCHSLSGLLGAAVRHANTAAAQGMEYKPARCCVTTSAP